MVFLDLDFIHGDHLVAASGHTVQKNAAIAPIDWVLKEVPDATSVRLQQQWVNGKRQTLYQVTNAEQTQLLNAESLKPVALNRTDIRYIANQYYAGSAEVKAQVSLITDNAPSEINLSLLPVWRADFNALGSPTLYFSAHTGELVTKRHDFWRVFDVFWMLHIMDYQDRVNVDTWWLKAASLANLVFLLSGAVLLFYHYRPRKNRRKPS